MRPSSVQPLEASSLLPLDSDSFPPRGRPSFQVPHGLLLNVIQVLSHSHMHQCPRHLACPFPCSILPCFSHLFNLYSIFSDYFYLLFKRLFLEQF